MLTAGPAYIKLGQALSIRPDLLSPAAMVELQKLCDKVPSFPTPIAMQVRACGRRGGPLRLGHLAWSAPHVQSCLHLLGARRTARARVGRALPLDAWPCGAAARTARHGTARERLARLTRAPRAAPRWAGAARRAGGQLGGHLLGALAAAHRRRLTGPGERLSPALARRSHRRTSSAPRRLHGAAARLHGACATLALPDSVGTRTAPGERCRVGGAPPRPARARGGSPPWQDSKGKQQRGRKVRQRRRPGGAPPPAAMARARACARMDCAGVQGAAQEHGRGGGGQGAAPRRARDRHHRPLHHPLARHGHQVRARLAGPRKRAPGAS